MQLADFGSSKKVADLVEAGSGNVSLRGTPYWMVCKFACCNLTFLYLGILFGLSHLVMDGSALINSHQLHIFVCCAGFSRPQRSLGK